MPALNLLASVFHTIPAGFRGKARLARTLLTPYLAKTNVRLTARDKSRFLVPSLTEPIAFHLLIDGIYESEVLALLLHRMPVGGSFVDVGANIGVVTVPLAKKVGPTGKVFAIEASPHIFTYLQENVRANDLSNVHLINAAAAEVEGEVDFFEAPDDHFGMGSRGAQFHATPVALRARTLDGILADHQVNHIDLLKIDVEGFEADVITGARRLLTGNKPPIVIFEFLDWAEARVPNGSVGGAQKILRDWGFAIWRLGDFVSDRPPLSDVLVSGGEMLVASRRT